MVEDLRKELKVLDEEIRKAQEKYLEVYNEYHLKRVEIAFEVAKSRIGDRKCFVDYIGKTREVELIDYVRNKSCNFFDIPSEKFKVRNVQTKSEFEIYISDLRCDIYDNGILCSVVS